MGYNDDFYKGYEAYLQEPRVRHNHNRMFNTFRSWVGGGKLAVIDLGCGTGEFRKNCPSVDAYYGVDKEPSPAADVVMDYTIDVPRPKFTPNGFVSLFSIEACLPASKRYEIYDRMFETYPIEYALVSGFYYEHASSEETISETGDITSFQTIEPFERFKSYRFSETRFLMETPSEFFGKDVVEVWKILRCRISDRNQVGDVMPGEVSDDYEPPLL